MNKERLIEKINEVKSDIQYILDSSKSKTLDNQIQQTKKEKLLLLKKLTDELKQVNKLEQKSQTFINNIKKIHNENDSINFKSAASKKNPEIMSKVKIEKQIRKESMNKYIDFLQEQKFYNNFDTDKIPGCLFLHDSIIKSYGLCPFIKIQNIIQVKSSDNLTNEQINEFKKTVSQKRQSWLESTSDNGELFWNLYDKIYNKKELNNLFNKFKELEKEIEEFIHNSLTKEQYELYNTCVELIKQYVSFTQKSKMIKEKYKSIIHNLSILISQIGFNIHNFLNTKFGINLIINFSTIQIQNAETFDKLLTQYSIVYNEISTNEKFINNTKNNLNNEMYLYLTNQKSFESQCDNIQLFIQSKKYFKRWALLTEAEKLERYESYANYHIDKYLIKSNIISINQRNNYITSLIDLLHNAHKNKELIFRDIKWSNKDGIIEQVRCLRFDKETKKFFLNPSKKSQSVTKKKISIKTIFSKETEKFINEEILCHIVLFFQKYPDINLRKENIKDNREACVELVKNKLKIKKLTNDDKKHIFKKYDDMFVIVDSNQE